MAKSYARIHWQNLVNFGILPLRFVDPTDYSRVALRDQLRLRGIPQALARGGEMDLEIQGKTTIRVAHALSAHQVAVLEAGGVINWLRANQRQQWQMT